MSTFSFLASTFSGTPKFKFDRLKAEWRTTRERLEAVKAREAAPAVAWWAAAAEHSLASAETALQELDLDGGWGAVHDAQRFLVFGMNDAELVAQLASLSEETRVKLTGWRLKATTRLLPDPATVAAKPLDDESRERLRQALVESLAVLHGHSDNSYHQLRLVGRQLNYLVVVCVLVLLGIFVASSQFAEIDSSLSVSALLPVALAGALGGIVSAMWQLSRVGQSRIPEAWLQGVVTSGRPLVGAASALFIYAVLQSDLIQLIDASKVGFSAALVLGFVAGFSEKFVLRTVEKVAGNDGKNATASEPLNLTGRPRGGSEALESEAEARDREEFPQGQEPAPVPQPTPKSAPGKTARSSRAAESDPES
ncbi:MAG: hypothetical protein H7A46_24115 [Verrucomicrobiales bacterium]|nr:hypothetical protein [Verrucomicrobiales bacterium]